MSSADGAPGAALEALDADLVARAQRGLALFMRRDDDDLDVVVSVEHAQPGSPLDAILRREQTLAVLELLRTAGRAA